MAKDPVQCKGRLADSSQCRSRAEQLHFLADKDVPLCHFHSRMFTEQGVLQPERKRKRDGANGKVEAASADDLDLADLGLDAAMVGTIRQRLLGVAHDLWPDASEVLRDSLRAEKSEMVTCPHCHRRHRRTTKDFATRLMALRLLLDKSAATPSAAPEETEYIAPGADISAMSTAQLRKIAFPREYED